MTGRHRTCTHLAAIRESAPGPQAFCAECLLEGKTWSSLRMCLTCGHVSCGQGSSSDHAAQHYAETDHPIAAVAGADPPSRWCYADERFV